MSDLSLELLIRIAVRAREALAACARRLTPEQRLDAQLKHSVLVTALHRAGLAHRTEKSARAVQASPRCWYSMWQ